MMRYKMHKIEMNPITLRNIPKELEQAIYKTAKANDLSLNKAVIALLQENLHPATGHAKKIHHDLDDLAGSWTKQKAQKFEKTLSLQRSIDPEIWE